MEELRERVAVVENEIRRLSSMPTKVERLEVDFSHMKGTLEDIRLQGMESSRREEAHYDTLHKLIENRISKVEIKQSTILTTVRVVFICLGVAWAIVAAWVTIVSPALDKRIESKAPSNIKSFSPPSTSGSIAIDERIKQADTYSQYNSDKRFM